MDKKTDVSSNLYGLVLCQWIPQCCHRAENTFFEGKGVEVTMRYCSRHKLEIQNDPHLDKGTWRLLAENDTYDSRETTVD